MASSSSAGAHTHPAVSPFEHMLDEIGSAYTGDTKKVEELVDSFLHAARTIAYRAGLGKAADGSGGSGQWQPNGSVPEERLQAALKSLDAVRVVLAAPDRGVHHARWDGLEHLMVSRFCLTAFCSFQVIHGLTSGIM